MSDYMGDATWELMAQWLTNNSNAVVNAINAAYLDAQKFSALTYGLSDAQILALPQFAGRSEADLTAMKYAWGVFTDLYNALNNIAALNQFNRMGYLVPFI